MLARRPGTVLSASRLCKARTKFEVFGLQQSAFARGGQPIVHLVRDASDCPVIRILATSLDLRAPSSYCPFNGRNPNLDLRSGFFLPDFVKKITKSEGL